MTLACASRPASEGSESSSESETETSSATETETSSATETGEENVCDACQPASDACTPHEGVIIGEFGFSAENLRTFLDGSFDFGATLCVVESVEVSDRVTVIADCGQVVTIEYSAFPPAPAPNVTPGTEVYITAGHDGPEGVGGGSTMWNWWRIELAENGEWLAYYRWETKSSRSEDAVAGVCEGMCDSNSMSERIGFPVSSGDESVVLFDGQHHVFSNSEQVWLTAQLVTHCDWEGQEQTSTILRVLPAP
jgi:hypothetical protein